ncbi:MAG: aminotransferase class III-fold pyridoxal phosphate-dependent enzyme, partial [Actinobacteria bacterium]
QAGTLSGNPLATAAGLATLKLLEDAAYSRLDRTTELLANGLEEAAREAGVDVQVPRLTGLVTIFFSGEPVTDLRGAQACDLEAHAAFCRALLERGVYPPPSQFEAWFPSLAHAEEHIERTVETAREAFAAL